MKKAILLLFLAANLVLNAKVTMPQLFADGMVLQRGKAMPVWGWADAGEQVTVKFAKKTYTATAAADGSWRVDMAKMKAGGPYVLTVNDIEIKNVMVGDVWLCSGQSNIDIDLERVYPQYKDEIDNDKDDMVRMFQVQNVPVLTGPQKDVKAKSWRTLSKDNCWKFTSLGYFLGKRMRKSTGVAQGIIQSSWGGTPIEAWLPVDSMMKFNEKMVAEMKLYQDEELVKAINNFNNRSNNRWQQVLDEMDPGVSGKWTTLEYNDSEWQSAGQYSLPVKTTGQFCGTYWLRQHITVDKAHAGKAAKLLLGTLYDADYTYINGKEVGRTYYQYPPRRYNVPEGVLREGDNVIAVRIINKSGKPYFYKDKPHRIEFADGSSIELALQWLTHDGVQMPRQQSASLSLQNMASTLYNGMLNGLAPYTLSGVVWYQGESNTGKPLEYEPMLGCLMNSWRLLFQQQDLPFTIVQLANFMAPSEKPQNSGWAQLRESQHKAALKDNRAELAVAIDLGEADDIHPLLKKDVAERCALAFDHLVFGKKVLLSPEVTAVAVANGSVTVTFDQPLQEKELKGFELAAADKKFQNVQATAKGNVVTIAIPAGMTPSFIRYAWKDNPIEANLRALNGNLPAVPFEKNIK
ncbi:MAG: sialate O-acetylesterase [Prevotella sp.]|nr:sialate O-acetylesterase [Candidatus Prevotella equi]